MGVNPGQSGYVVRCYICGFDMHTIDRLQPTRELIDGVYYAPCSWPGANSFGRGHCETQTKPKEGDDGRS